MAVVWQVVCKVLYQTKTPQIALKNYFEFKFLSFMKPLLTHHVPALTQTMPRFCFPLANLVTSKEQEGLVSKEHKLKCKKNSTKRNSIF